MERLTCKADSKSGVGLTFDLNVKLPNMDTLEKLQELIIKLFDYEQTGLSPERCAELAKADQEGLPMVGSPVYCIVDNGLGTYKAQGTGIINGKWYVYDGYGWEELGKIAFSTREEAEKALESEGE